MVHLEPVTEENWLEVIRLSVEEEQKRFLADPMGILARGYVYRACHANVFAICCDADAVGLALVRDMEEEPACYELQQFMIDQRWQNRGIGAQALEQILALLAGEGHYPCVEVCVNREDAPALHLYRKLGFVDTGYVDPDLPDCLNLRRMLDANGGGETPCA